MRASLDLERNRGCDVVDNMLFGLLELLETWYGDAGDVEAVRDECARRLQYEDWFAAMFSDP